MRSGLARTALEVAQVRARESIRTDRLFNDPYAGLFVTAALGDEPETQERSSEATAWQLVMAFNVAIRTRFFDDYLIESSQVGCTQVCLLGAGLDTRAFRLDWPTGSRIFEIDLPDVLNFKEDVLHGESARAGTTRTVIASDLRQNWDADLLKAGFDPAEPTAWLAEGLLVYLSADEAARFLTTIGALSAPGSRIAFEHAGSGHSSASQEAEAIPEMRALIALVKGGLGDGTLDWLSDHDWQPQVHSRVDLADEYGRAVTGRPNGGLVTATRQS